MEYEDLYVFPEGHPPSPYHYPVTIVRSGKVGEGTLPVHLRLCAVGWLERPGFPTGQVSDECIDALVAAHPSGIIRDGTRGVHNCTLCSQRGYPIRWRERTIELRGHGHYLIQMGDTVYMAPELLLHYIFEHRYCPPQEFVHAVVHGDILTEDDLDIQWRGGGDEKNRS